MVSRRFLWEFALADTFVAALWQEADIVVGAADTTLACREAQKAHGLVGSAAVALGRLLTGVALLRFCTPRQGSMSLQTLTDGRLHQVFADVTDAGHLRGYCKGVGVRTVVAGQRASVAADVGAGMLSVLRSQTGGDFTRSTTEMVSGEIDVDLASYATQSDQVATLLVADVLLDEAGHVVSAGGVVAQALPSADLQAVEQLRQRMAMVTWLQAAMSPQNVVRAWQPQAEVLHTQPLTWRCRCSQERAEGAIHTLSRDELAAMVSQGETADINCEFCGHSYSVSLQTLEAMLANRSSETMH